MAKNPNPTKKNRHTLYLAATGYGKTTALKATNKLSKIKRLIIWDAGLDHKVKVRTYKISDFYRELIKQANKGAISLSYCPPKASPKEFKLFCQMVWQILDGKKDTYVIVEECARVQAGNGKAGTDWSTLIGEGRKFGLVILATSQRSQNIDKEIFSQVQNKYIGPHDLADAKKIAVSVGVTAEQIYNQKIGEFYLKELGPKPAKKIKIPPP